MDRYSNEEFVRLAYHVMLQREPKAENVAFYADMLKAGRDRFALVRDIYLSPEFASKCGSLNKRFHDARVQVIRENLPKAKNVLDLGGASRINANGALIEMGYPGKPYTIDIIDLPLDQRIMIREGDVKSEPETSRSHNGTSIRYFHQSMSDLSNFPNKHYDFVWSGETIEHLTKSDADTMLQGVRRVLVDDGVFALDTPNRKATRLLAPRGYVHVEHKNEYYFDELTDLLARAGFSLVSAHGMIDMRRSIASGRILIDELLKQSGLNDSPDTSYGFFVKCRKR